MKGDRIYRVNRLLKSTLAALIPMAVKDPRIRSAGIVSIADVHTTRDLGHAKVYVSVYGDEATRRDTLAGLHRARAFLRRQVAGRTGLKRAPELHFELDTVGDSAERMESVLREIEEMDAEVSAPARVSIEVIAEEISRAGSILVTSHPNPDGDAVGSMLGAYWGMLALGKDVQCYNPDPLPQCLRFLAGSDRVAAELPSRSFEATLILDCADARMFPGEAAPREQCGTLLVVDHHKTQERIGTYVYRDPSASAAGVLLYRLLEVLKVELDRTIAECLYCALLSDTGSFRYQNTNAEAFETAAALMRAGIDPWRIASNLYESRPRAQLDLLAMALGTLCLSEDGLTATMTVTEAMLQQTGGTADLVDGFINYARSLRGVEVAVLFRPTAGRVRVSLRSRGAVDVSAVAADFGGGGHHNAAGFMGEGADVASLRQKLFARVSQIATKRAPGRSASAPRMA